jgi:hypothetical protein
MKESNKTRIDLWHKEVNRLIDIFDFMLSELNMTLIKCSMERISFSNGELHIHFGYVYDRYQKENNTDMPMAMILFGNDKIEKNLIDIFKEKVANVDFFELMGSLNKETNDQSITYSIIIQNHIFPFLRNNNFLSV